jgi:prepilin-type N-terminal cleavage/methylation domain-containing protein
MQKSKLIRSRKGFTLVEVALAVAVGLIVIGGAIVGFNAVRENAQNSAARGKVDAAVAIVENLAASNNQIYPASNTVAPGSAVSTTWAKQRPDFGANPWGGPTGDTTDGVTELAPGDFGSATSLTAPAAAATLLVAADAPVTPANAGNLIYKTAATQQWGTVNDASIGQLKVVKGYVVSIYDKTGTPWYANGGK